MSSQIHTSNWENHNSKQTFDIQCDFDASGVWSGFVDFVESLSDQIPGHLINSHRCSLQYMMPWLIDSKDHVLSLTDISTGAERVRSYAADRAQRIPHDIAQFIVEMKQYIAPRQPWILHCYGFSNISYTGQLLIEGLQSFIAADPDLYLTVDYPKGNNPVVRKNRDVDNISLAGAVFSNNDSLIRFLPQAISTENDMRTLVRLKYRAVVYFCANGFYKDAARYAENLVQEAVLSFPGNTDFQWSVSFKCLNTYLGAGRIDEALRLAEDVCPPLVGRKSSKKMSDLLYMRAVIYSRFMSPRNFQRGEALLSEAISVLNPEEMKKSEYHFARVFLANGIAMIRTFQGKLEEALEITYKGIAELDENVQESEHRLHRSVLVYNLAQVYTKLHRHQEALEMINKAIEVDPNYSEYYNDRGSIFLALGRYSEALKDYEHALQLSAPYYELLANMAQCYRLTGRLDSALNYYRKALRIDPNGSLALVGAGACSQELGSVDETIYYYTLALVQSPDSWELLANRAAAYYERDSYIDALADIELAIKINPEIEQLHSHREAILEASQAQCTSPLRLHKPDSEDSAYASDVKFE